VALHISNRYSTSGHTRCSVSHLVTCSATFLILASSDSSLKFCSSKRNFSYSLKRKIKLCQIRAHRWPQNLATITNLSSRKCCTKNFHNMSKCGRAPSCWKIIMTLFERRNVKVQYSGDVLCVFGDRAFRNPNTRIIFRTQRI
jgi:hypothetical protein